MESVSTSTAINPASLPPTARAAFFHGLHVHLKVAQWEHLELNCLTPTEWGWQFQGDSLVPVKTDLEPAPESLLKFIRCSCKTTTKKTCGSQLCSCRKSELECVSACADCRGKYCGDQKIVTVDMLDDQEDDRNIFDMLQEI